METIVSVIVPVYKVEQYLDKCVESLTAQTYRALEIILVDDQSPDGCPRMCDEWAQRDSRIRVIHKRHEGVGKARNTGMEAATGAYLAFVDADDYLPEDAIEVLVKRLISDGSDMAIGKDLLVYEDGFATGQHCAAMKDQLLSRDDFLNGVGTKALSRPTAWGKLYTRKALDGLAFPSMVCGEDEWLFPLIVLQCETISVVDHLVYYYFQRPTSAIHTKSDKDMLEAMQAHRQMMDVFLRRGQLDYAANWLEFQIDLAWEMVDRKAGTDFVKANLEPGLLRKLLRRCSLRGRVRWFFAQRPRAFRYVIGFKRKLTAVLFASKSEV